MATSIQRIAIIVAMLDILLFVAIAVSGMGYGDYSADDSQALTKFQFSLNDTRNMTSSYMEYYPTEEQDSDQTIVDKTFGNVKYAGKSIFRALALSLDSLDFQVGTMPERDRYKVYIQGGVSWVYWIVHLLLGIEIFFIFYSKKNT